MGALPAPSAERSQIGVQRQLIRPLLVPTDPTDAMTAYYALMYDPRRVQLTLHTKPSGQVDAFVAVCQTGRDLFVPLVVMRGPWEPIGDLLRQAMHPGRSYEVITTPALRDTVGVVMLLEWQRINSLYVLDPSAYRPVINVMVQPGEGPFRFEVRANSRAVSASGINWQSSRLAEMYVHSEPGFRGRGWGKAVGARCVQALLEAHLLPLYTVAEGSAASQALARTLGFRDSGAREFECRGRLRP